MPRSARALAPYRRAATGLVGALLLACMAPPAPAAPATAGGPEDDRSRSNRLIDAPAHGEKAIAKLGPAIAEAAARNDMSVPQLARLLRRDLRAWVDTAGRLLYIDTLPDHADVDAGGTRAAPAAPYAYDQTFLLASKPGSARTIYLDFDGHVVSGTAWNKEYGVGTTAQPAFDLDGAPATFGNDERDVIQGVWQRVSEDFAPFDVNVTTADPGTAALRRTDSGDGTYGVRALVTPSTGAADRICGGGCGGVAYMSTFNDISATTDYYEPAWVFPHLLGDDTKAIAEAVSHEVGHNLGLEHDGPGYYEGHGGWAPIMGIGYQRPITQWSRGEYTGANNTQNDLTVIANHGAAIRRDDHGDTTATATALGTGTTPTRTGIISNSADQDHFSITRACGGTMTIDATPAPTSPNLDISLKLFDAAGVQIAVADPLSGTAAGDVATGLDARISQAVPAGLFYVEIDGVGARTPAGTGYSDYASVGAYTVTATGCGEPSVPTSVVATKDVANGSATLAWQPPANDGGNPVTSYTLTRTGASPISVSATARSHTFAGLSPGAEYTLGVAATNASGTGQAAVQSVTMVAVPPSPPQDVAIEPSYWGASAALSWQPPETSGDSPLTGYRVERSGLDGSGNPFTARTLPVEATYFDFVDLQPAVPYEFTVYAVSSAGRSVGVVREATLVEPSPPTPPQAFLAVPGDGSVTLTWTPPADHGSSALEGYDLYVYEEGLGYEEGLAYPEWHPVAADRTSYTVTGLTNGQTYRFGLSAYNSDYEIGAEAFTDWVTPIRTHTVPGTPGIGKAVSGARGGKITAKAVWTAPASDGGSVIAGYRVTALRMSSTGAVLSRTVSGLRAASSRSYSMPLPRKGKYRFTVQAVNALGSSTESGRSNLVTGR